MGPSNSTLFQSDSLPILHSSNPTLPSSNQSFRKLPILHFWCFFSPKSSNFGYENLKNFFFFNWIFLQNLKILHFWLRKLGKLPLLVFFCLKMDFYSKPPLLT